MDQKNGKGKLTVAAVLAFILVAATCITLFVLKDKGAEETAQTSLEPYSPTEAVSGDEGAGTDQPAGSQPAEGQPAGASQAASADDYSSYPLNTPSECQAVIDAYAAAHGIDPLTYPIDMVNLLYTNPDTLDFVLHYPEYAGTQDAPDYPGSIDVTGDFTTVRVPEYYQFDLRWGYRSYAGGVVGINGSGPTALSMVVSYLLGNRDMNPAWMAAFAENNNYTLEGGTNWTLMSDGATGLGIDVTPITADQDRIERNLDVGNIVMCLMGPGDFTTSAQYILIVGYSDEGYEIRDPGSPARTSQLWQYDRLAPQMDGCWIMRIL